jgi:hypothetical protein
MYMGRQEKCQLRHPDKFIDVCFFKLLESEFSFSRDDIVVIIISSEFYNILLLKIL